MRRLASLLNATLAVVVGLSVCTGGQTLSASAGGETTIQPETRARLKLQTEIHSKLSETDDIVTATLAEPIYVEGRLALPRGIEFVGHIANVARAKRGQRSSRMSIQFDRIITPSGEVPIAAQVTAIDDWDSEETIKADREGKLKGGHSGRKTIENAQKGSQLGFSGSLAGILLGGAAGASGRQVLGIGGAGLAAGMIVGLMVTKGSEIRVKPGAVLRIRFVKTVTLPGIQQPATATQTVEVPAVSDRHPQKIDRFGPLEPRRTQVCRKG